MKVMIEVVSSREFDAWLAGLKDRKALALIGARLERLRSGNMGDVKPVGDGITEARIHVGPGYRLYWAKVGATVIILLCGGAKGSQVADISRAKRLWREFQR